MTKAHIVLIPGDGVGQEVIPAAATVLRRLLPEATLTEAPAGFAYFQQVGEALPEATLTLARQADAVLFGATASPLQPTPGYRSPILALRQALGLYANLRPVRSLPGVGRAGVDMLIVRENSEGLYYSPGFRAVDWALNKRIITRRFHALPIGSRRVTLVATIPRLFCRHLSGTGRWPGFLAACCRGQNG
ncbi:MAG TPA: hypothetical protein EYP54_09700, partial [Anaerolineales bacterium]|nr:hypothetical protein [Anaerolineales bacterium]